MSSLKSKTEINRRDFLRTTAAAGAGLIFAPMVSAETENTKKSDEINVALLGAGAQGQVLMAAAIMIPSVRFKAVCDIWESYNLKKVSGQLKRYGHENNAYVDYHDMLAKEKNLNAVIIATPDFWHAEHTEACLKAGLHVYCEKEMSNTLEGARRMVQAARETGKLLQIGHQRRSNPRYIHCCEKLIKQAAILGRITTINGQWNRAVQPDMGFVPKYAIDEAILNKYGFKSMQHFRNWRWYKGMGGGPIVDLGSHQIDIYNWFLGTKPISVMASGGTDYYDKKTHEWYDNVMAIYEYQTKNGVVRAFYQTLTTNSNNGYFETFMGDQGTLCISESAGRGAVYREVTAPEWDKWVKAGFLLAPAKQEEKPKTDAVMDVRETAAPSAYELAVKMDKKYHHPHLENFFNAVRGKEKLNCPAEEAYESAVTVLKVNDAIEAARKLNFNADEFKV